MQDEDLSVFLLVFVAGILPIVLNARRMKGVRGGGEKEVEMKEVMVVVVVVREEGGREEAVLEKRRGVSHR